METIDIDLEDFDWLDAECRRITDLLRVDLDWVYKRVLAAGLSEATGAVAQHNSVVKMCQTCVTLVSQNIAR